MPSTDDNASNSLSPRSSVSRNRSSSSRTTRSISSRCSTSSGYQRADLVDDDRRQPVDRVEPDPPRLHDRAPDQAAENIVATLVAGRDPLCDQERHATSVVGEHAVSLLRLLRARIADSGLALDPVHDQPEPVGVEDRVDLLEQHRRRARDPCPVSMFCFGSGVSDPSACRSYSMNTRFQNSMNRSQRSQFGPQDGSPQPCSAPRS